MQDYAYSVFSIAAIVIHLIFNFDLLFGRGVSTEHGARYRGFLFGVLVYYVADASWGILAGLGWLRALYVEAADDNAFWAGDVDLEDAGIFKFYASAFGKVDMKVSNGKSDGYCDETKGCDAIYTPKSYSGWFVGYYDCVGVEDCFRCECEAIDVFGGTWKPKFQKKYSTLSGAAGLAGVSAKLGSDE